jgi:hypothetical protein
MENQMIPEAPQSRADKTFFIIFGLLLFGSIFFTYYRIMIQKNYVVEAQVDCDPYAQKCFVWECDPASTVPGESCTGDPEEDSWYYNLAKRNAANIPLCDPEKDENCTPMVCDPSREKDCEEVYCDAVTKVEQEVECSDPVEYTKENPPEEETSDEEAVACEEGDSECEAESAEDASGEEDSLDDSQVDPTQTDTVTPANTTPPIK